MLKAKKEKMGKSSFDKAASFFSVKFLSICVINTIIISYYTCVVYDHIKYPFLILCIFG